MFMVFPSVKDEAMTEAAKSIPAMVSLSAKVATAYLSTRGDVPIEQVPGLIEGVYRSLKRLAIVEETGAGAVCRILESQEGRRLMDGPLLRLVGGPAE